MNLLNQPIDISHDFFESENEYYVAGAVTHFDAARAEGMIQWDAYRWVTDWSFNRIGRHLKKQHVTEAFWNEKDLNPNCRFGISFINARTIRIRIETSNIPGVDHPSLMLQHEVVPGEIWQLKDSPKAAVYAGKYGSVSINKELWRLDFFNAKGEPITNTTGQELLEALHPKSLPFLFTRRSSDYSRSIAATFALSPGEKIYGGGESFTSLDKRGQKLVLFTSDAQSTATRESYKPIPFLMSNKGYGIFFHS